MCVCFCCQEQPAIGVGEPERVDGGVHYGGFVIAGCKYMLGESVYLPQDTHTFPVRPPARLPPKSSKKGGPDPSDEVTYPELYRKSEYVKGSNSDVPKPFQIGGHDLMIS